jgi:hypothetical protein
MESRAADIAGTAQVLDAWSAGQQLDVNTPASTRVRAAEIIVNHAAKAIGC